MRLSFKEFIQEEDMSSQDTTKANIIKHNMETIEKKMQLPGSEQLKQAWERLQTDPILYKQFYDELYPQTNTPTNTPTNTTTLMPTPASIEALIKKYALKAAGAKLPPQIQAAQMQNQPTPGAVPPK